MVGGEANEVSLTSYISEDSILTCEYELTAPQDATYLQINVEQYSNGESDCLFTGGCLLGRTEYRLVNYQAE
mgnify:CR=1 FL=1